jgi:hypothetical protein
VESFLRILLDESIPHRLFIPNPFSGENDEVVRTNMGIETCIIFILFKTNVMGRETEKYLDQMTYASTLTSDFKK